MIRRLGKGGMAEVFLARQEGVAGFRRLAVVKRLLPQFSSMPNVAEMLLDEARIAAQLSHPNIVQIYELNKEDGQYFIAMEFVDGCDLATLARIERRRKSRVPIRLALRVIAEAAMGLDYAHRQVGLNGLPLSLVHRDVSPHNVLCSREGAVKVTDFGIAKAVGKEQVTEVGVVKGKVHYMSPEQYTGGDVDKRSDIFSLGVVLYQLTTGRLPRVSKNGQLNMRQVTEGRIPRPIEIRADYPEDLDEIVMRALAQNPGDRYQDCASLRDDLLDFARQHDLLAFPNELGDYVNGLVPPQPLVDPAPELNTPSLPDKGAPLAPMETEGPRSTERVSLSQLSPNVTAVERRVPTALARTSSSSGPFERVTDIPIDSDRPTVQGRGDSSPAVLPNEQLTPLRRDRSPSGAQQARVFRLDRRRDEGDDQSSGERAEVAYEVGSEPRGQPREARRPRPTGPEAPMLDSGRHPRGERTNGRMARPVDFAGRGSWLGVTVTVVGLIVLGAGIVLLIAGRRNLFNEAAPLQAAIRAAAGELDVLSDPPKASVFVDGAQRCETTPCRVAGLPLSRELVVTVRGEGRYDLWVQRVVLSAEQPRLLLKAALSEPSKTKGGKKVANKRAASSPGKTRARKKSSGSSGRKRAARTSGGSRGKGKVVSVAIGRQVALLAIDVRPGWAEIWIDKQRRGHTPMQLQVEPGSHTVELKNPERKFHAVYRVRAKTGTKVKITDKIEVKGPAPQPS